MLAVTLAYSSTELVSPASFCSGLMHASIHVVPPSPMTPCSSRVSTESRYGTCEPPLASAVSTRPNESRLTLIWQCGRMKL
eukprot:7371774-Prymnesium_polylepis.1